MAPSPERRKRFRHQEKRFPEFASAYRQELDNNPAAADFKKRIAELLKMSDVLLLYAPKDKTCNHANVLMEWLEGNN